MLTQLDKDTYLNLDAIASAQFSEESGTLKATVKFLSGTSSNSLLTDTFTGQPAEKLYEVLSEPEIASSARSTEAIDIEPCFQTELTKSKSWQYYTPPQNPFNEHEEDRHFFLAFVNSRGSCSMRSFDAETGAFIAKKYRPGKYQNEFYGYVKDSRQLTLNSQPNLERDCRERLPDTVLAQLKKQVE